jgi:MraZ protein
VEKSGRDCTELRVCTFNCNTRLTFCLVPPFLIEGGNPLKKGTSFPPHLPDMLLGEYQVGVADKNRISLPRKLLSHLNGEAVITRGYEQSLILVDNHRWESLIAEVNAKPLLNLSVRDTKRFLIGGAFEIQIDAQGRFVLPESLKTYAEIGDQISILGVGEWIEIWDFNKWQTKLKALAANSADIADRLSNLAAETHD